MCTFMLPDVEKHFRQHWHLNALIPVCVFMCAVRVLLTAKALKHCLHLKGFSWVWMRMWRTRSLGFLNSLEQYGQPCQRTPFSSRIKPENGRKTKASVLQHSYLLSTHFKRSFRPFLPGICMGFLKMLLFFSLSGFSGPCTFLLSSVEASLVWFCGSLDAASPCGWTTLSPLFSRACYQRKQGKKLLLLSQFRGNLSRKSLTHL